MSGASVAWRDARRIVAVRLDTLGDVVMTGPALRALRSAHPERHLTLLTSRRGAEAASLLPEVDEVLVYEAPWMKATPPLTDSSADLEEIERLREGRFDAAVIFTVYSQSPLPAALLLHYAGVPLRLAYCRENPYHLLSDWVREPEPENRLRHEVRRHLDLVASVGAAISDERLRVSPSARARERIASVLREMGVAERQDWVVLHPGASAPSRRYPPDRFAATLRALSERGVTAVLTGSAGERELVSEIIERSGADAYDLSGRLDLHELTALLERAPLLLSNNTGPVHLAAGTGTPVVDLYALTNPQHTPWMVPSRVLYRDVPCRFCYRSVCPEGHHRCLTGVEPDEVVAAVLELFGGDITPDGGSRTETLPLELR